MNHPAMDANPAIGFVDIMFSIPLSKVGITKINNMLHVTLYFPNKKKYNRLYSTTKKIG